MSCTGVAKQGHSLHDKVLHWPRRRSAGCAPRPRTQARPTPPARCRSTRKSGNRRTGGAPDLEPSPRSVASCRAAAAPPDSATTPATRKTTQSRKHQRPAPRGRPTASIGQAPGSTAASGARARGVTAAWPRQPTGVSSAASLHSPAPPACRAPRRPGSSRATAQQASRSSERTHRPPAAVPAASRPSARAPKPSARPSCDHTRPAPPLQGNVPARSYASRNSITSSAFFNQASKSRLDTERRQWIARRSGQERGEIRWHQRGDPMAPAGRSRGHQRGDIAASVGRFDGRRCSGAGRALARARPAASSARRRCPGLGRAGISVFSENPRPLADDRLRLQ